MSLLLDALKRAEQEKLARQGNGGPSASPGAPRAASAAAGGASGSLELQPLARPAEAAPPKAPAAGSRPEAGVQAAQNVFQAKSPPAAIQAGDQPRSRTLLWVTLGAIGAVAIAAGAYVWYSVQALTPQYSASARTRPLPPPVPAVPASMPPTTAAGSIVPAPGAAPAAVEVAAAPTPPATPAAAPAAAPASAAPRETAAERLAREAPQPSAPPPLRMDRAPEPPRQVPAEVAAGYDALRQGDYASARRSYQAAIASDPRSVDAHLGLATIAARDMNRGAAAEHYRRVLDADPRNATAIAGLVALADHSRPEAIEAQLRADIGRIPDSAALHFTLGNLYASQSRWSEAQSSYFDAHRLDPGSADIAYNLAVSLDQLGQRRVAAEFYARALEAARGRSAQFDPSAAARRLQELR